MSGIDHLIPIAAFGRRGVCTEVDLDRAVRAEERPPWGAASIHGRFKRVGELLRSRAALTRQCLASAIPCARFAFYGLRLDWIPVYDFHSFRPIRRSPCQGWAAFLCQPRRHIRPISLFVLNVRERRAAVHNEVAAGEFFLTVADGMVRISALDMCPH